MRVFVTGGTGFVGGALVQRLLDEGHEVTVLVHRDPGPWGDPPRLARAKGDAADARTYAPRVRDHDAFIHLVAIRRGSSAEFERLHTHALRQALEAATGAGIKRFLYMSASGIKPNGTPYQRTKWESEEAVEASRLDWTIFRPTFIVGAGHGEAVGFDEEFVEVVKRTGAYPNFGGGAFGIQPVALQDVALAFARALTKPAAIGKRYELGGPRAFPWEAYLRKLREASGVRRPILYVPKALALAGAATLERFKWFPASRDELTMLFEGHTCDPTPAVRDLGLTLTPYEEAAAFLRERFQGEAGKPRRHRSGHLSKG